MGNFPGISAEMAGVKNNRVIEQIRDAGVTNGLSLCLDVADIACFSNTDLLTDLSDSGYNFANGIDTTSATNDMTLVGALGGLSKNTYFSRDVSGARMTGLSAPSWSANMHKNGASFSLVGWFYLNGTDANVRTFFATFAVGSVATRGMALMAQSGQLHFMTDNAYRISGHSMLYDQWIFVGASILDDSSSSFIQLNGSAATGTPALTTTSAASGNLSIASNISGGFSIQTGSRFSAAMGWNRPISQAEMLAVYNATKDRFQ